VVKSECGLKVYIAHGVVTNTNWVVTPVVPSFAWHVYSG